jgi:hypothetical protein
MSAHAVDLGTKQQGNTWLLPPYSYSLRQIASELEIKGSVSNKANLTPDIRQKFTFDMVRKQCTAFNLTLTPIYFVVDKGIKPVWVLWKARHGITLTLPNQLRHNMMKKTVKPTSSKPD